MEKTYHIITIGCQMNKSDSERIAAVFEEFDFSEVSDRKEAGFVVLTTCGVRQSAEDRAYGLVGRIKKENPNAKMIIAGCLSEREDVKSRLKDQVDLWLPADEILNLKFQILNKFPISTQRGLRNFQFPISDAHLENSNYLSLSSKRSSSFSAFVPIGNGCDNFCTYCVVPYARGREVYRLAQEILAEVEDLVKRGYKEIVLIAQNVNSYSDNREQIIDNRGLNNSVKATKFHELLRRVNSIEGDFWIRFATSHPKDMSDELIEVIAECEKVCNHIHLPAQAGDDKILERMNRKYTVGHYLRLIEKIRFQINKMSSFYHSRSGVNPDVYTQKEIPAFAGMTKKCWKPLVSITTDIIVGFPGETEEQFQNTEKLFEKAKFDMAYIAQYSPRPGTAAEKMADDVPLEEKKRREEELMEILRKTALENNQAYLGQTVKVLVEEKNKKGEILGRTSTAKTVRILNANESMIGSFVNVNISSVQDFGMEGFLKEVRSKK